MLLAKGLERVAKTRFKCLQTTRCAPTRTPTLVPSPSSDPLQWVGATLKGGILRKGE